MALNTKPKIGRPAVPQSMSGHDGWEDAPTQFTQRHGGMLIYGDTGSGRTRLALTAPGPIALAHTAEKIQGTLQQYLRSARKQVRVLNFGVTAAGDPQSISDQVLPVWERMTASWMSAGAWASTQVMDTDSEAWELIRLAYFGELNPKGRTDSLYGPVNARWKRLFNISRQPEEDGGRNIVVISQTKDEYIDKKNSQGQRSSERTGRTIRAGQKGMPFWADVIVRTEHDLGGEFRAIIEKGWFCSYIEGTVLRDEEITFANIMGLCTETDPTEWENWSPRR